MEGNKYYVYVGLGFGRAEIRLVSYESKYTFEDDLYPETVYKVKKFEKQLDKKIKQCVRWNESNVKAMARTKSFEEQITEILETKEFEVEVRFNG